MHTELAHLPIAKPLVKPEAPTGEDVPTDREARRDRAARLVK